MWNTLWSFIEIESYELVKWAQCGEGLVSAVPTVFWAVGSVVLAQRMISALFRRFAFRRVPFWELVLQNLLFLWMVIYSLHFWALLVKIVNAVVEYCYTNGEDSVSPDVVASCSIMQLWVVFMLGVMPLVYFLYSRPKPETPPLMIWITTNPWQRREMGPYGYYLNRPPSTQNEASPSRLHVCALRRALSDSTVIIRDPPRKKRYSKSV